MFANYGRSVCCSQWNHCTSVFRAVLLDASPTAIPAFLAGNFQRTIFPADNTPTLAVLPLSENSSSRGGHIGSDGNPEKAKERRGESAEPRTKAQLSREAGGADENLEKAKERRGESAEPRAKAQMSRDPGGGVGARREARRGLGARRGGRAGGPRTNSCSRSGIAHLVVCWGFFY